MFIFLQTIYTYKMAQEGGVVQCSVEQFPNFFVRANFITLNICIVIYVKFWNLTIT